MVGVFLNKNKLIWENKTSIPSLKKVMLQAGSNSSELSSASQEPTWLSFGKILKMFITLKRQKK